MKEQIDLHDMIKECEQLQDEYENRLLYFVLKYVPLYKGTKQQLDTDHPNCEILHSFNTFEEYGLYRRNDLRAVWLKENEELIKNLRANVDHEEQKRRRIFNRTQNKGNKQRKQDYTYLKGGY